MSRFWEIVFCVPLLFRRQFCLSNLKHAPSCELPLTARKTVFSHLNISFSGSVFQWYRIFSSLTKTDLHSLVTLYYAQNRIPFSLKLNYQAVKSFSNETKIWWRRVFWMITMIADSSLWLQRPKIVSAKWRHLVICYLWIWLTGVIINSQFLPGSDVPYRTLTLMYSILNNQ